MDAAISTVEFYVLTCEEPRPGTHERLIAPLWKQSLGFAIHCVAGDATGIGGAAIITTSIVLPRWGDTIIEYAAASGWSRSRVLFMRDTLGGSYPATVKSTALPESLLQHLGAQLGPVRVGCGLRTARRCGALPALQQPRTPPPDRPGCDHGRAAR
jgi:hypothetical protein